MQNIKVVFEWTVIICVVAVFITALLFYGGFLSNAVLSTFGVERSNIERKIYKESTAYNEGMSQQLDKMQLEYIQAAPDKKFAIRTIILHQFSNYPQEAMSPSQRLFYTSLQNGI